LKTPATEFPVDPLPILAYDDPPLGSTLFLALFFAATKSIRMSLPWSGIWDFMFGAVRRLLAVFETVRRADMKIYPLSIAKTVLKSLSVWATLALTRLASVFKIRKGGNIAFSGVEIGARFDVCLANENNVVWTFTVLIGSPLVFAALSLFAGITTFWWRLAYIVECTVAVASIYAVEGEASHWWSGWVALGIAVRVSVSAISTASRTFFELIPMIGFIAEEKGDAVGSAHF
jgi:hypothetical protein